VSTKFINERLIDNFINTCREVGRTAVLKCSEIIPEGIACPLLSRTVLYRRSELLLHCPANELPERDPLASRLG
jgi:hypothetical protein